jgi:hypothetical protein
MSPGASLKRPDKQAIISGTFRITWSRSPLLPRLAVHRQPDDRAAVETGRIARRFRPPAPSAKSPA